MNIQISVSRKTLSICAVICAVGILAVVLMIASHFYTARTYPAVQAEIIEAGKEVDMGFDSSSKRTSITKFVRYEYLVDGIAHETKVRTFFLMGKHEGKEKILYVDARNPEEVRDPFVLECCIIFLMILGLFELFCIAALRQTKT